MNGAIPPFPHTSSWRGAWSSIEYVFMAWYLVKHRDSFPLPLPYLTNTTYTKTGRFLWELVSNVVHSNVYF
jgi:hypothetical protein